MKRSHLIRAFMVGTALGLEAPSNSYLLGVTKNKFEFAMRKGNIIDVKILLAGKKGEICISGSAPNGEILVMFEPKDGSRVEIGKFPVLSPDHARNKLRSLVSDAAPMAFKETRALRITGARHTAFKLKEAANLIPPWLEGLSRCRVSSIKFLSFSVKNSTAVSFRMDYAERGGVERTTFMDMMIGTILRQS